MQKSTSSLFSVFFIVLCLNSIVYYDIQNSNIKDADNGISGLDPTNDLVTNIDPLPDDDSFLIRQEKIPGNYFTKGFFSYSDIITSPNASEGSVYQFEDYNDISHDSSGLQSARYGVGDIGFNRYPPALVHIDDTVDMICGITNLLIWRNL